MDRFLIWFRGLMPTLRMPSVRITDILEILILAFLVYYVLNWIKRTRAWTLLKGILTIVVAVSIVYLLHMDTLMYLVNQSFTLLVVIAAVVFQPELRKALEQLGERSILSGLFMLDNSAGVEERFSDRTLVELVKAAVEMGRARTGALIVIAQNETLEEYERTGISIDAEITSQLLINIFEHNTPLHDGAVIIASDRVKAATCYLPLSDNMDLSKELGTRHRAGVGISEVTDSFTIIVSEETGNISTACKGVLNRNLTGEQLKEALTVIQNKSVTSRKFRIWKGRGK